MDTGVLAAIRRLPKHKKVIEELVLGSESFRNICGDLAEAELALRRWEASEAPGAAARRDEYRHLIDGLEAELRQAIHERQARHSGRHGG
ncbi:hypothetical protein DK26_17565 [Bosea sp. WAO]|jgi:hypothetical protein|nr:hypothetical protein DK26_17565 [Bosea sp. WAO]